METRAQRDCSCRPYGFQARDNVCACAYPVCSNGNLAKENGTNPPNCDCSTGTGVGGSGGLNCNGGSYQDAVLGVVRSEPVPEQTVNNLLIYSLRRAVTLCVLLVLAQDLWRIGPTILKADRSAPGSSPLPLHAFRW
jgi:hypothetical protein